MKYTVTVYKTVSGRRHKESMKKRFIFIFLVIGIVISMISCLNKKPEYTVDELVYECDSPDKTMKLKIYQGPTKDAIMVDFYVVGEIEFKAAIPKSVYKTYFLSRSSRIVPSTTRGSSAKVSIHIMFHRYPNAQEHRA